MSEPRALRATYTSPNVPVTEPHVFNTPLKATAANPSPEERTAYLDTLLSSVQQLQNDVNTFLTNKMEEDNKAAGKSGVDDAKEEENYGEEVVDE